jgi:hypothetical protein
MALSFALPSYAQQKDLADTQTTQKILTIRKEYDEAINNDDAAAIAAFFARRCLAIRAVEQNHYEAIGFPFSPA